MELIENNNPFCWKKHMRIVWKLHIVSFNMKMTDFVKRTSNRDRKLQSRLNECATNIATYAQKEQKTK